jgi:hypothetical protein
MSTTPPSDPWETPPDRPDQAERDQPRPEQPTTTPGGPPSVDQPPADPWGAPPAEPGAGSAFESPGGDFSQQPPAYPPAPTPPQVPYGAARPTPTPPPSILTAVKLMYAGAALSAISFLTSLLTQESVRDQIAEANPDYTEEQLDTTVAFGVAFAVVIGLIAILLWVWMAETNRRGKSWARVVATVLGALNIVFTVVGLLLGQSSGLVVVFSLVSAALAAVILYLLYRPESNTYYEEVADIRR